MQDKRLQDILSSREENYVIPFYWQHGNHRDKIPEQVDRIFRSGCRAICVEARPHPKFCEEEWWQDMEVIIRECASRSMKIWILDDKHFPTGFANGIVAEKYPERRQWLIKERHLDVIGPAQQTSVLLTPSSEEEPLVGVFAYRRVPDVDRQIIEGNPVVLTDKVRGGTLCWDIPEGCWRLFFVYRTRHGGNGDYIDMISAESAGLQIEAVYEPHFQRLGKYFGSVIAGFFSDEPQFHNQRVANSLKSPNLYEFVIGQESLALPFNDKVVEMMSAELGEDATPWLGELWYESKHSPATRLAYMNAITILYRECFSRPVGNWCRAHGVEYIGHIIEDMNAHCRMGYGPGHYFRALDGQDMGGIDIVLHQVMPGFGQYIHTASGLGGAYSPAFFDYVLGKLGASIAHQNPRMRGRAMCEVFGAYGWGEGATMMKWLIDFLLVRGINYFVPHAFSPEYPDPDCPPHFGAEGHDPQFEGFSAIMSYANKMAHLLSGARHVADVALLYHAEAEWMSGIDNSMLMQEPARVLYDRHIDFDIVCADTFLADAAVRDGRLEINGERFASIVAPGTRLLPAGLIAKLREFEKEGVPVFFADTAPDGSGFTPVALSEIADAVSAHARPDIEVEGSFPLLRCYHAVRDGSDVFFFFNESPSVTAATKIRLPAKGSFARLRLLEDVAEKGFSENGSIGISLLPGQSEAVIFTEADALPTGRSYEKTEKISPEYAIEIAESDDLSAFRSYTVTRELFNINGPEKLPDFSGKMKYTFRAVINRPAKDTAIDLGEVGQTAELWVNGEYAGIRVAKPYLYEIGRFLKDGENEFTVIAANTLAQKERDYFSTFLQLQPAGLLGPVTLRH